ncbi:winged helix-turn-helix transcriptional regulator [Massilia agri]|uniref:Winged helix-turn-helix transcriptional regulator n=1 Tax=Massilia agri TaxID=1886785 RepID=A0ABT2AN19_9BURK|nr:winged helix-turn-helix transcriptional regulator [Massilia agri]MCS0597632.1 winged helix-turn-helix transcriptional regulator [Massilia agri]
MNQQEHSELMAELGRKGGLAKGAKYKIKVVKIIQYFVNTRLNQQEIAEKLGVSQAMVNKYVNSDFLKIERLKHNSVEKIFTEDEIDIILQKIQLEKELKKQAKILKPKKIMKI